MNREQNTKPNWFFRNLANLITIIGLKLSFALLWVVVFHRGWTVTIFLLVAGVLLTDFLDGSVARYFGIISKLGAAMDRLRDKIFQLTMFSFFVMDPRVDPWLKVAVYPLIVIEMLLLAIWFLEVRRKTDASAGIWGKAKMFLVSIGILACPAIIIAKEHGLKVPFFTTHVLFMVFAVSFCLAAMSFKKHFTKYREHLKLQSS